MGAGAGAGAYSLGGASNIKLFGFHSEAKKIRYSGLVTPSKATYSTLESWYGLRIIQTRHEPMRAAGFDRQPCWFTNSFVVSSGSSSGKNDIDVSSEEEKSNMNYIIPSSPEVQSLLTTICDTTSVAEFKLNLAGFRLYVKRNLDEKKVPPPPSLPIIQTNTSNLTPGSNGTATTTSLAISKPKTSSEGIQRILNVASDEGLVILQSPKVGFFRRSRTIKGKRAPPSCREKQEVKEGQVLCYVEQLGGEIPIESDVSGEVVEILRKDGEAVGYGDPLISILPCFPGIKKLQ